MFTFPSRKSLVAIVMLVMAIASYTTAGVIQAIIPGTVPVANKRGSSSIFQLAAGNSAGVAGAPFCDDGSGNATTTGCSNLATLFSSTTQAGPNNSAVETSLIGSVTGSSTIAANTFSNGRVLDLRAQGIFSLPSIADSLTVNVKCGSTIFAASSFTPAPGAVTNGTFRLWLMITSIGSGATGAFMTNGAIELYGTAHSPSVAEVLNTANVSFDFTAPCLMDVTAQWGAAQVGESITGTNIAAWIPGGLGGSGGGSVSIPANAALLGSSGTTVIPAGDILQTRPYGVKGGYTTGPASPVVVANGATYDILPTITGPGIVDSVWVAFQGDWSLSVPVDGELTPSLNTDAGYAFFTARNAAYFAHPYFTNYGNAWGMQVPIPFTTSIKLTLTNTSGGAANLWSVVTYETGIPNTLPYSQKLFVSSGKISGATPNSVNTFVNYVGGKRGRLLGMLWGMDTTNASNDNYPMEGTFQVYLDGAASPTMQSSGTEDWFHMAGYFGGAAVPTIIGDSFALIAHGGHSTTAFRVHEKDPIYFQKGLKITWNAGNTARANWTGTLDVYYSVLYYLEN